MASDKLDIIIAQQAQHGAQLAQILGTVGEHTAEIRGLREGVARVEKRIDCAPQLRPALDESTAGEIAVALNTGKASGKLIVFVVSAIAAAVAAILGGVLGQ